MSRGSGSDIGSSDTMPGSIQKGIKAESKAQARDLEDADDEERGMLLSKGRNPEGRSSAVDATKDMAPPPDIEKAGKQTDGQSVAEEVKKSLDGILSDSGDLSAMSGSSLRSSGSLISQGSTGMAPAMATCLLILTVVIALVAGVCWAFQYLRSFAISAQLNPTKETISTSVVGQNMETIC